MAEHQYAQQPKKTNTIAQKQTTPTQTAPKIQLPSSHPMAIIQRARINPKSLTHADVMQLQRTIGNRAVGKLLTEIGLIPSETKQTHPVQMQTIPEEEKEPLQEKMMEPIHRKEILEDKKPLQGKIVTHIQLQEIPKEEEPLQGKFESKLKQETCYSCSTLPIERTKKNYTGMPDDLKDGVENLSGLDMSNVRVHYNSDKPADVGAYAYTQERIIHIALGQEKHLPHEAWHVVQQAQGRVKPTIQFNGIMVNDDIGLEQEADEMGQKALKSKNFFKKATDLEIKDIDSNITQRVIVQSNQAAYPVNPPTPTPVPYARTFADTAEVEDAVKAIKKRTGQEIVEIMSSDWKLQDGKNYFVGHGSEGVFDGKDPDMFVDMLLRHNLQKNMIIKLIACNTGKENGFADKVAFRIDDYSRKNRNIFEGVKILGAINILHYSEGGKFIYDAKNKDTKKFHTIYQKSLKIADKNFIKDLKERVLKTLSEKKPLIDADNYLKNFGLVSEKMEEKIYAYSQLDPSEFENFARWSIDFLANNNINYYDLILNLEVEATAAWIKYNMDLNQLVQNKPSDIEHPKRKTFNLEAEGLSAWRRAKPSDPTLLALHSSLRRRRQMVGEESDDEN